MNEVKRYECSGRLAECANGQIVYYSDVAAAIAERDAAQAEVERLRAKHHEAVALLRRCLDTNDPWINIRKYIAAHDAEEAKLARSQ
jgi:hypothetical protein